MEWNGASDKYFCTSDKDYRVSISFNSGEKIYTAWPAVRQPDTHPLGNSKNLQGAQQICEEHYKKHMQKNRNTGAQHGTRKFNSRSKNGMVV